MAVLDAFMAAFNARDIQACEAQLHFPHYRIASGTVSVIEKAGTRPDLFKRFAAATPGWDHSAWEKREVIQSGPSKVHVELDSSAIERTVQCSPDSIPSTS